MNTAEYQDLRNEISRLGDELRDMGDNAESWTEEQTANWEATDNAYRSAVELKAEEDEKRQSQAVKDRLQSLDAPIAKRSVEIPRSIATRMVKRPAYHGRLMAFRGENALDDAYDCGLWIKSLITRDRGAMSILDKRRPEWRQQLEGTDNVGGFTVPDPLSAAVIEVINETGVGMRVSDVIPMTSDTLRVPKIVSGQTVYYPGEATGITASEIVFAQVALAAVKRATLTKISNELMADSVIAMADRVARRAAYELAWNQDNEFINGDGEVAFGGEDGVITALGTAGIHTGTEAGGNWDALTLADFNATMGMLPDKYWLDNQLYWIMRRDFYASCVQKLMYAAGGNTTENIQRGTGPTLMGYPIAFTARMPDDGAGAIAALFGNFMEGVIIGNRNNVDIASSADFAFDEDVQTIRTTWRYDIEVHEPGDSSDAGAYVGLKTAAA